MKFNYEYRTSDNVCHVGTISATDRDAVYAKLKSSGIRPGKVTATPGLLNQLVGRGKRWLAILILTVLLAAIVALWVTRPPEKVGRDPARGLDQSVMKQLIAAGHDPLDIQNFLEARRKLDEEYRAGIVEQVKRGTMTKTVANELLSVVGLKVIE